MVSLPVVGHGRVRLPGLDEKVLWAATVSLTVERALIAVHRARAAGGVAAIAAAVAAIHRPPGANVYKLQGEPLSGSAL